MPTPFLPCQRDPIAGTLTTPNSWYEFFRSLRQFIVDSGLDTGSIDQILARLDELEESSIGAFVIQGLVSVEVLGIPQNGVVQVQLVNDETAPPATFHYGTDVLGNKGWHRSTDLTIYLTDPDGNFLVDPDGNYLTDGPNDNHNALNVLQQAPNGVSGENYHLSSAQATAFVDSGIPSLSSNRITDWNAQVGATPRFVSALSSATGTPIAASTSGTIIPFNANSGSQFASVATSSPASLRMFYRAYSGGVFSAWAEIFHDQLQEITARGATPRFRTVETDMADKAWLMVGAGGNWDVREDDTTTANTRIRVAPGGNVGIGNVTAIEKLQVAGNVSGDANNTRSSGTQALRWSNTFTTNLILGANTASLGGGAGVAFLSNATTDPTTTPVGGGVMWSTGGSLRYSTPGGNVATVVSNAPAMQMVYSLADLPAAVASVITLAPNVEYRFGAAIDLAGSRIVCSTNNVLSGRSFSSSSLTSTGLAGGSTLITSTSSLKLEDIALSAPTGTLFALNNGATGNLLITGVAILSTPTIGTVQNYGNIVIENTIVQASANWTINGTVGSFATFRTLLGGLAGQTTLTFPSTLTITRRISILYSVVDTPATGTGINASTSMTIPDENYVVDNTVFSGAGTPIAGLDYTSNKSAFFKNVGIQNSSALCQYSMTANATATVIAVASTFVKIAGTTTASAFNQKFSTATTQRAAYTGAGTNLFRVAVTASMTSGNNQTLRMRIAKNGTTLSESNVLFKTTGSGEASAVPAQTLVSLAPSDYVEVFVTNDTAATNITVSDLNVTIVRQD